VSRDRLLTRDFVLASVANLLQGMSFFLFVHLPRFLADMGAEEVLIGVLVGVTALSSIVIRPLVGQVMDLRGRRPVILAGGAVNLIATLGYLAVTNIGPILYGVRIIHGVAEAAMFTALFTYGADIVPESRRTEGLALFGASGLLPLALAGVVGDVILSGWGFEQLFAAAAGFGLLSVLMALLLPERAPALDDADVRRGFFQAVATPQLRPIWWIAGMFSFVLTAYFTFLRTFIDETGFGSLGLFFGTYALMAIGLRLFFGWVPEKVGQKRVLYASMGVLAAGLVVLAGASSSSHLAFAGVLCGVGHGYGFPILFSMTVTRAPVADRGSSVAFFTALFGVGTLAAGPILGAVIAVRGYPTMFVVAGILTVVSTVIFGRWDRAYDAPAPSTVAP